MNSAFVGYEELSRSLRVLSISAVTPEELKFFISYESRIHTDTFWGPLGDRQFGVPVVECNRKEGSIQK